MILTVKPLQGKECSVQVCSKSPVSLVLMKSRLTIEYCLDEHRLCDYSIGPEAKLNLVVRPAGERPAAPVPTSSNSSSQGGVWQTVSMVLAKHFSPADAAKVHEQLIKDYERSLRQLSLDDIERLAGRLLHPEGESMDTSYMD
uniref:Ubl4 C-terminal TUGS domain-containing protein n=1 Tax=Periophthalmus magnuspinnatus TaxID=409849 RepID=A0A3B4ADQ4_9GOBI